MPDLRRDAHQAVVRADKIGRRANQSLQAMPRRRSSKSRSSAYLNDATRVSRAPVPSLK
ncbi:hypothetical protein HQN90_36875 [Paenibacillus alba]|uniref:hypothetical protein n=1 Tax=Paenibacillus alba TaxID=1197127 RepID=UPI00156454F7|nr:hypothetical protein [Paenibacillus alba]